MKLENIKNAEVVIQKLKIAIEAVYPTASDYEFTDSDIQYVIGELFGCANLEQWKGKTYKQIATDLVQEFLEELDDWSNGVGRDDVDTIDQREICRQEHMGYLLND
jgi:hypothetical protein